MTLFESILKFQKNGFNKNRVLQNCSNKLIEIRENLFGCVDEFSFPVSVFLAIFNFDSECVPLENPRRRNLQSPKEISFQFQSFYHRI